MPSGTGRMGSRAPKRLCADVPTRPVWHPRCSYTWQLRSVATLADRQTPYRPDGDLVSPIVMYEGVGIRIGDQSTAIASISIIQSGCARAEISTSVEAGAFLPKNSSRINARSMR